MFAHAHLRPNVRFLDSLLIVWPTTSSKIILAFMITFLTWHRNLFLTTTSSVVMAPPLTTTSLMMTYALVTTSLQCLGSDHNFSAHKMSVLKLTSNQGFIRATVNLLLLL